MTGMCWPIGIAVFALFDLKLLVSVSIWLGIRYITYKHQTPVTHQQI